MDERLRDLKETVLAKGKYVYSQLTYALRGVDGVFRPQRRFLFRRSDAATILPYDAARKTLILTRQFRLGAYMNDGIRELLEACAGVIDPGETPLAAIRREAMEETGLRLDAPEFLFEAFVSPASSTEKLHFFVAPYDPTARVAAGGGLAEEDEDIEVVEVAFAEALDMAARGRIRDAKTLVLLYWLEASGRMD